MDYAPFKIPGRMAGDFLYRSVIPPLGKKSRLLRLCPCKRGHNASAALPTFCGIREGSNTLPKNFRGSFWEFFTIKKTIALAIVFSSYICLRQVLLLCRGIVFSTVLFGSPSFFANIISFLRSRNITFCKSKICYSEKVGISLQVMQSCEIRSHTQNCRKYPFYSPFTRRSKVCFVCYSYKNVIRSYCYSSFFSCTRLIGLLVSMSAISVCQ